MCVALTAHAVIAVIVVGVSTSGFDGAGEFESAAIIRGALLPEAQKDGSPVARVDPVMFEDIQAVAFEPGVDHVRRAAALIVDAADRPPAPDAIERLSRKAEVLEQISSPAEVSKMAGVITGVLGIEDHASERIDPAGGGSFDFNHALLTGSIRVEDGDRVRIIETLKDSTGNIRELIWLRSFDPETDGLVYEQSMSGTGEGSRFFASSAGEFEDAEVRHLPFAVINRYPLVGQLHREAVLPILRKLSEPGGLAD